MLTHRLPETEDAAREALELARASGDPDALWRALLVANCALWGSPRIHERQALADEFMARSAPGWHKAHAHRIRTITRYVAGDLTGSLEDAREMHRLGRDLRMGNLVEIGEMTQRLLATLDGDFDRISPGKVAAYRNLHGSVMLQTFEVRRAQGRLEEWLPTLEELADKHGVERALRAQRTLARAVTGRVDDARRELDALAAEDPSAMWGWSRPHCYAYLGEAAVVLGEPEQAAAWAALLRPYGGQLIGPSCCPGSADRFLGLLAAAQGGWEEAEAYLEGAIAFESRLRVPLLLARTRVCFARMLLARDAPGDRERAAEQLSATMAETATLDMDGVRAEAAELLGRL